MIVPSAKCRPNPGRAIYIQGLIDQRLVDKLTPEIIRLTGESREPITIYIDSRGGSVASSELLLRLMSGSNQDLAPPCRLITVVTSWAASAAADLLSSGDYAIAYPDSTILYHGVRSSLNDPLTVEVASFLAENMKLSNDRYAMALARKTEWRFMFRFMTLRSQFDDFRIKSARSDAGELDCFLALTREKLSSKAKKILDQAEKRHRKYNDLLIHVLKFAVKRKRFLKGGWSAGNESVIIRGIIDFELKANRQNPAWTFRDGGLARLNDDFFLLQEYLESAQSPQFKHLCDRWSSFVLTQEEKEEIEKLPEEAKLEKKIDAVRPHFQPLWSFFVALCHALQEGENELGAVDAFWLGLIDEIIGVPHLQCFRMIEEFEPDPVPAAITNSAEPQAEAPKS